MPGSFGAVSRFEFPFYQGVLLCHISSIAIIWNAFTENTQHQECMASLLPGPGLEIINFAFC